MAEYTHRCPRCGAKADSDVTLREKTWPGGAIIEAVDCLFRCSADCGEPPARGSWVWESQDRYGCPIGFHPEYPTGDWKRWAVRVLDA